LDIRDVPELRRCLMEYQPQTLFHLAAIHYIPTCSAEPLACIGVNVDGTQAVLDACAAISRVQSVVLASSAAVYRPSEIPHGEESALGPTDVYGHTKLWAEQLMELFRARSGIGVGIARLFNVFGPGETNPHLIPTIIAQVRQSRTLHLGNLSTARDYVYVDDVAAGLMRLGDACRAGRTLLCNFGSERAVDGWSLIRLIETVTGEPLVVEQDPARMRASDRPILVSNCERARMLLNWEAETTLEMGIAETLRQPWADMAVAG
jgi:UDP-glucose 4-epimerase